MSLGEAVAWTWIGMALAAPVLGALWFVASAYVPRKHRTLKPNTHRPRGYDGIGRWNP